MVANFGDFSTKNVNFVGFVGQALGNWGIFRGILKDS
jgi:hypothetical protein